jgi:glutamate synthase (NADPH/NADH) large chain
VVVLGETGQNFGAGMSGGYAFVWDVKNNFASHCNPEMIDLEPVTATDRPLLISLLEKHAQYTGSSVAQYILQDFENALSRFVKVFPKDLKKALEQKEVLQANVPQLH